MNRTLRASLLFSAMAFLCGPLDALDQTENQGPIDVKLCEVTAHSEKYNNKRLRIHASVESDGMHTTLLTDRKCATGILLYNSDEVEKSPESHPDVQSLERAIEEGRAGTLNKRIEATFAGLFLMERAKGKSGRLMKLEAVTDLKVSSKKNAH